MSEYAMHRITFIRHGESAGNANGQIQGQSDLPLTKKGEKQALGIAQTWQKAGRSYDQIIASPLMRARRTAEIISDTLGLPLSFDPIWAERGFGDIEGRLFDEIIREEPSPDFNHPYLPPGGSGESIVDVFTRASQALQGLLRCPAGSYLIVSHGALLNMVMYAVLGISPHNSPRSPRFIFSNTGYIDLTYNPDIHQWRIQRFWNNEDPIG
jgi:broad specificity phosphatase PhoE